MRYLERLQDLIIRAHIRVDGRKARDPFPKVPPQRGNHVEAIAESLAEKQRRLELVTEPLESRLAIAATCRSTERLNAHAIDPLHSTRTGS